MRSYLETSRSHTASLLFALPLLLAYEAGAAMTAQTSPVALRNGADVLLRTLLAGAGVQGTLAFGVALAVAGAVVVAVEQRRRRVRPGAATFAGMLAESVVYALLFGVVVGTATRWLLGGLPGRLAADGAFAGTSFAQQVVLSLGAGIYEELLFRVLLAGGLFVLFTAGGLKRRSAGIFAALLAALLFSAFHYVGPYADAWALGPFTYRFVAGLALNALFLLRGFGITAWTHALYDLFLVAAGVA